MPLLEFQRQNIKNLNDELQLCSNDSLNRRFQIVGARDSGRRYAVECLDERYFVLSIKNTKDDNSLAPVEYALKKYANFIQSKQLRFNVGFSIWSFFVGVDIKNCKLSEEELRLIWQVNELRKKRAVVIVVDYEELNEGIAHFINSISSLSDKKRGFAKRNPIYVIYLTDRIVESLNAKSVYFKRLPDDNTPKREKLSNLGLNGNIILNDDEVDFIFNIVKSNITDLKTIVDNLNNAELSFRDCRDNNSSIVGLLNQCFNDDTQKEATEKILAYCSYSDDFMLCSSDLSFLLGINIGDTNNYLDAARKNRLIELQNNKFYILIAILKTIYKDQFQTRKGEIYGRLCEMIAEMYPSDYKQKYLFAKCADDTNAYTYFCQHCMQEIRSKGSCDNYSSIKGFPYADLLDAYKKAKSYMHDKKYDKAIQALSNLQTVPLALNAEIKLLLCQAYMKSLDNSKRALALNTVEAIETRELDGNLKYRVCMFIVVAHIHMGNYSEAYKRYYTLRNNIENKYNRYQSDELGDVYHTLLRKSNMINNYRDAVADMENARDYFRNHADISVSYYLAVTNCLGIHVKNMDLEKAKIDIAEMERIKHDNFMIKFPREYIYYNNRLVYMYFSGERDAASIATEFKNMYDNMDGYADKFLAANNYAVFTALSGDIGKALSILDAIYERDKYAEEKESIYYYKYRVNSAIMRYILDNSKRKTLIKDLSSIRFDDSYPNNQVMLNEVNLIISAMKLPCKNIGEWMSNYNRQLPSGKPKNGFEVGFVITEVFSWDDD